MTGQKLFLIDLVINFICVGYLELLFLSSEVKMAAPDVEFMTKECRGVMNFLFLKVKSAKEIYDDMSVTSGEKSPSYSTVKNWVAPFKTGNFSTEDEDRTGRPLVITVPEDVDAIHSMILAGRTISTKKIADTLEISRERVGFIIHDDLDMRKLSAKWVPKCLNADHKRDHIVASQAILEHFRQNTAGFLARLVTMDETWMIQRQKNKQTEWRHIGSPHPKKF
jgi:histone-lysine N-methyltransferase SETMAR